MPWVAVGYNKMLEFMIRYEELGIDAYTELHPIPTPITLYLEYYKKHIGWAARSVESFIIWKIKPWYEERSPELKYWPRNALIYMRDNYHDPHPKTGGVRIFKEILLPGFFILVISTFLCCRCCCGRKDDGKEKED